MKNYLVTGTNGFIGSAVRSYLETQHCRVVCLEKDLVMENALWKNTLHDLFVENTFDGIFHIGACADTTNQDVNYMMLLNYEFTQVLCDLAKANGTKIVYSSSAACYGTHGSPTNLYGWSKYLAENYITCSGNGVSLRYFNVFGPGEEAKGKMASVAYQAYNWQYRQGKINPFSLFPGKPERDFIHINDVVTANIHAMNEIETGTVWDVGSAEAMSFEAVLDIMDIPYQYTNVESIPKGYQYYTAADPNKFMPGWLPTQSTSSWYKSYKNYLQL